MFVQDHQAPDRAKGGLGLGLAIVRSITHLHGGTVSAQSEGLGSGSTFTIRVPGTKERRAAPRVADSPGDAVARGQSPYSILIVDDNEDGARSFGELLSLYGHTVHIALDGPSALDIVNEVVPHIAFLDIGLPGMDGYELATRLREMPKLKAMRLIALSGYGLTADRIRSIDAGFEMHLVKPLTKESLDTVLRGHQASLTA
jgi:CheY-like chemotaxis protein